MEKSYLKWLKINDVIQQNPSTDKLNQKECLKKRVFYFTYFLTSSLLLILFPPFSWKNSWIWFFSFIDSKMSYIDEKIILFSFILIFFIFSILIMKNLKIFPILLILILCLNIFSIQTEYNNIPSYDFQNDSEFYEFFGNMDGKDYSLSFDTDNMKEYTFTYFNIIYWNQNLAIQSINPIIYTYKYVNHQNETFAPGDYLISFKDLDENFKSNNYKLKLYSVSKNTPQFCGKSTLIPVSILGNNKFVLKTEEDYIFRIFIDEICRENFINFILYKTDFYNQNKLRIMINGHEIQYPFFVSGRIQKFSFPIPVEYIMNGTNNILISISKESLQNASINKEKHLSTGSIFGSITFTNSASCQYNLGEVVNFSQSGNYGPYIIEGWEKADTQSTWTNNKFASLCFYLQKMTKPVFLNLNISGFTGPGLEQQSVEIFINNKVLESVNLGAQTQNVTLSIPLDYLIYGNNLLTFSIPNATSPKKLNPNWNNNNLRGISIKTLSLTTSAPNEYNFGDVINFSDVANYEPFLSTGWGKPKNSYIWTVGPYASLKLFLSNIPKTIYLSFNGKAFTGPGLDNQTIQFEVNEINLTESIKMSSKFQNITLPISSNYFIEGMNTITFIFPNATSPNHINKSMMDTRKLGIYISNISLTSSK